MRKIYNGSISYKILFQLRNYGDAKRSSFISTLSEHCKQSVESTILKLLKSGQIEEYKKAPRPGATPVRYLRLSTIGKTSVVQLEEEHGEQKPNLDLSAIRREERKELVMRAYNACRAMGMLVEECDKPNLSMLISPVSAPTNENEKEKIREMREVGAYYSLSEIRKASRAAYGSGPLNQTRCIGVVIRGYRIYFIYNMGGKLLFFNATVERKTKEDILKLFERSLVMRMGTEFTLRKEAPCILFGNSYNCVAQLFYKRHAGCLAVDKDGHEIKREGNWVPNKDRISMDVLGDIFSEVYFVSSRDAGAVFGSVTTMDAQRVQKLNSRWLTQQSALRIVDDNSGAQAVVKGSGDHVFIWLDNDLKSLYELFKRGTRSYVIIPMTGPEKAISKVLGTSLVNIQAIGGTIFDVPRFDNTGHPIKKD